MAFHNHVNVNNDIYWLYEDVCSHLFLMDKNRCDILAFVKLLLQQLGLLWNIIEYTHKAINSK